MASYKGSPCKGDCAGHRAGARYATGGGRSLTRSSSSFNAGMRVQQGTFKRRGIRTRMSITKHSK